MPLRWRGIGKYAESARSNGFGGASVVSVLVFVTVSRSRSTVVRVSAIMRAAPRADPQAPLRRRWAVMTGAVVSVVMVVMVVISELRPRMPEYP